MVCVSTVVIAKSIPQEMQTLFQTRNTSMSLLLSSHQNLRSRLPKPLQSSASSPNAQRAIPTFALEVKNKQIAEGDVVQKKNFHDSKRFWDCVALQSQDLGQDYSCRHKLYLNNEHKNPSLGELKNTACGVPELIQHCVYITFLEPPLKRNPKIALLLFIF